VAVVAEAPGDEAPDDPGAAARRHILTSAKGGGFLAGGSFFEMAARFGIAFVLARAVGATGYGLYNLAVSAGALFAGLAALGLDDAMVRYVAIQARRRDERGLLGTLQIGIGISLVCGVALGVVMYVGAELIAEGLFHETGLASLLRLFGLIVPFMTLSNVLAAIARGFKRMDYAAFSENVVMSLVRLVLLVALIGSGLDVAAAVIIFGISDVTASVVLIVLVNREIPLRGLFRTDTRRDYREVFAFALPLWTSGLLLQLRKNMETLLLGALSVAADVGLFSIVARINLIGHVIYLSTVGAVKPVLAELSGQGERAELRALYRTSTRWTFMCNIPFFLVMVLYPEQLLAVFGASFTAGAGALVVLAFAEFVNAATGTCGSIIDMTGHTRVKLANSVAWIALLLAGNVLLIPRWGVLGAAVASLLSIAVVNVARVIEVWVLEQVQPYDRTFVTPILAGLVAYGAGMALGTWGPPVHTAFHVAVNAIILTGVYGAVSYVVGVAPEDRDLIESGLRKLARIMRRGRSAAAPTTADRR
jgi:O-antigen/teichoic acid export membrane protein